MTTTQPTAGQAAGYAPAAVKKRRVATVLTAGVAGVAGVALAATAFSFSQAGTGTFLFKEKPTPPALEQGDVVADTLELGAIPHAPGWAPVSPTNPCFATPTDEACRSAHAAATPPSQTSSTSFSMRSVEQVLRAEVRTRNVTADDQSSALFRSTWIRIERRDPRGEGGANDLVYQGPLAAWAGTYVGNFCPGKAQDFDVRAWSTTDFAATQPALAFQVTYDVGAPSDGSTAATC